jgi:uncharacterized protein (DUF885 family)
MGVHEQDGRLGAFDAATVREHLAAFRSLEVAAEALEVESAAEEVDRTALLDEIRATIFRLHNERAGARNPALWMGQLAEALGGRTGRRADGQSLLSRLRAVPAFLHSAEASLTEPAEALVELAGELVEPTAELITRRLAEHPDDPDLYPLLREAAMSAESALARFRLALDTEVRERAVSHPAGVGEEHFDRLLHHQQAIRAGAPELWRQVLRLEDETLEAMRKLAHRAGAEWRMLLEERLEQADMEDAVGPAALQALQRLTTCLGTKDLLPLENDALEISPMPAWRAPAAWPATYLPPPRDGERADLLLSDSRWSRAFLEPIVAEQGMPGLHLQALMSFRQGSEVRRLWNPLVRGSWGIYVLDLLLEAGCWTRPEDRLAVKAHQLFRLVLARVDLGVHTRQMTVTEAVRVLRDRLPLDRAEALAAVRSVLLAPTQAAGAVSAWQELARLRADTEKTGRPSFSLRGFHERVLACGGLPAPLVRWSLES